MELLKRNIHMDRVRNQNEIQFTLEEDRNIPDAKPDASMVISDMGEVTLEEIRPVTDQVNVRGKLHYQILYASPEENVPQVITGEIPFEEQIHEEGVKAGDAVTVHATLQDLTTSLINSRKISIQSIIQLKMQVGELYDEDTTVGVQCEEPIEYSHTGLEVLQTTIQKKDIFRIREELTLPHDLPNIVTILWKKIRIGKLEWKPMDGKIGIQGEVHVFVLYETAEEDNPVQSYQAVEPFAGTMECQGCKEDGILEILFDSSHRELEIHADHDGEERCFGLEVVLDLAIQMYEREPLELLSDVYGVTRQVKTRERSAAFRKLAAQTRGRQKLNAHVKCNAGGGVRKILTVDGNVLVDHQEIREQGGMVSGSVEVEVFYQSVDREMPYHTVKESIPFTYTCEANGLKTDSVYRLCCHLEEVDASMLDSEEAEVRTVLFFELLAFEEMEEQVIEEITMEELDQDRMNALPGIAIYVVQKGDTLWKIGKQYFVPVAAIKEMNNLSGNEIHPGEKLLIMKSYGN